MHWQLAPEVVLRPEHFGGMLFHRGAGLTLEVDQEAYAFLCTFLTPQPLPPASHPAALLLPQLLHLGLLVPAGSQALPVPPPAPTWLGVGQTLSAPEVVHLAIHTPCNLACPACYALKPAHVERELTPDEWCSLIDQWTEMRVFQLAIGGGEPLLYAGLLTVLRHAHERGLVANLTTNGSALNEVLLADLVAAGVRRINVSWNGPGHDYASRARMVQHALRLLRESPLHIGVNLLVTRSLLPELSATLRAISDTGAEQVVLLRPKPSAFAGEGGAAWYNQEHLRETELRQLGQFVRTWRGTPSLALDSELVGLLGDLSPHELRRRGVYGCAAGERLCTVWSDGRVSPCSFLPDMVAGNVREHSFAEIWQQGRGWEELRAHLDEQGGCTGCAVLALCRGARCIARYETGYLNAGDLACPHQPTKERTYERT